MRYIKVYGTDGDDQLSDAFKIVYPEAYHLLCDIHVRDNIENKLSALNIHKNNQLKILNSIFGLRVNDKHLKGLVDSESEDEIDNRLIEFLSDLSAMGEKEVEFSKYFLTYKVQKLKYNMRSDIRETCGLGYPPKGYNQNPNESSNRVVKRKITEKCTISKFVDIYEEVLVEQNDKVKVALLGVGDIRIRDEFKDAFVDPLKFQKMLPQQKDKFLSKLDNFNISEYRNSLKVNIGTAYNFSINGIPDNVAGNIFRKSSIYLKNDTDIVRKPQTKSGFLVPSKNSNEFHTVTIGDNGKVTCDKICQNFKSFRVCSHIVAVAKKNGMFRFSLSYYFLF